MSCLNSYSFVDDVFGPSAGGLRPIYTHIALRRGSRVFTSYPGQPAALTVIDGKSHNLAGTENPIFAVVSRATGQDIETVLSGQSSDSVN